MRTLFLQFASLVWVVHAVFGASFHHTHPGADLCSATPGDCEHACRLHDHDHTGHEHTGHDHAGRHADHGHAAEDADPHQPAEHRPATPDHSCPGHHRTDDGSSGFVKLGAAQSLSLLVQSLSAEHWLPRFDDSSSIYEERTPLYRGPPLRSHLVLGVLLI